MKRVAVLQVIACLACFGLALVLIYDSLRAEASSSLAREVQAGLNVQANAEARRACAVAKQIRVLALLTSKPDPLVRARLDGFVDASCRVVLVQDTGPPPPTDTEQLPGGDGVPESTSNDPGTGGGGPPGPPDDAAGDPPLPPLPPLPTPPIPSISPPLP